MNPEKIALRIQVPFNKNGQVKNFDSILGQAIAMLHEKASIEHKYLLMTFVLSDESVSEETEEDAPR